MVLFILCALISLGALFGLLVYSRRRSIALLAESKTNNCPSGDRESFADYYRPMVRLLDGREFEASRTLSGVDSAACTRFRLSRIKTFRSYLRDMRLDFHRIEFKMRYLMLAASKDQTDLVVSLNQVKSSFQMQLLRVEVQLVLFRFGLANVEVEPLVSIFEQLEGALLRRPSVNAANA